ncbi:hypothetical protein [Pontiella agarivorans]|uniref:Uncharacterized protein n=1 Tax=Pontiella agarivorans TaxID=3038953 RepID=A0ABU5MT62_9BACT|nr:hypothetical protein [Pontiella agarivorans]MDZ8117271.1 hypothetical protein [Pontiella agarivorans]
MSAVLVNLAMAVGSLFSIFTLVIGLLRGVPIWTGLFRASIVMAIGTVVVMAFFRFFNVVLFRFLAEKLKEHREREAVRDPEGIPKG